MTTNDLYFGMSDELRLKQQEAEQEATFNEAAAQVAAWTGALKVLRAQLKTTAQMVELLQELDTILVDQPRYNVNGKDWHVHVVLMDSVENILEHAVRTGGLP